MDSSSWLALDSSNSSSAGTSSGGSLTNRIRSPSPCVKRSSARNRSLRCALSALRRKDFTTFCPTSDPIIATRPSMSSREYQTSSDVDQHEVPHGTPVGLHDPAYRRCALGVVQAEVPPGDLEARSQTLEIPLERPRMGFVEVVDTEHEPSVWCREATEVRQMGVAAQLDLQPRGWPEPDVAGHDRRCPTKERERRGDHPPVANGYQLGNPRTRLQFESLDRVDAIEVRCPLRGTTNAVVDSVRPCRVRPLTRSGPMEPAGETPVPGSGSSQA